MSAVQVSTVSSLYDIAAELLDAVVAAMSQTEAGPPDRQFVSLGAPDWETSCAQACVQILALTEEQTSPITPAGQTGLRFRRGRLNMAGMVAYAIRCVQTSEGNVNVYQPVTDATRSMEAKAAYEDGWAIWNYVATALREDRLFYGQCSDVHFDVGTPVTPSGGLGGWAFNLRAELNGYKPTITT